MSVIAEIVGGEHDGVFAFVTWGDGELARVTPVIGDPMASIEVEEDRLRYLDEDEKIQLDY